jgi:hypothetical protein
VAVIGMSKQILDRIQRAILSGEYDLTFHAVEEMAEDYLDIFDVEAAIQSGSVVKTEADDVHETRYTVLSVEASITRPGRAVLAASQKAVYS